jgi:small-conductance mechanosensitive channel
LIEVKAYSLTTRHEAFVKIKQEILLEIYQIVLDAGAEMALPTTSVEVLDQYTKRGR